MLFRYFLFVVLLSLYNNVNADNFVDAINQAEQEWSAIFYLIPKDKQAQAYKSLITKTKKLIAAYPVKAEPLIWHAIAVSSNADVQNPFDALESIHQARDILLKALNINPTALNGSAYVTLGSLYYLVPGWPIAFGDDEKAREMLQTALKINPRGIESNYFYGDFLLNQDEPEEAVKYFQTALQASSRNDLIMAEKKLLTRARLALKKAKADSKSDISKKERFSRLKVN